MAKEIRKEDLYKKKGIDYKIKYKDNSKRTCPYYLSADSCAVDDFVQSDEIKSIASMYPLNNVTAERVEDIVGSCNRSVLGSGERTVGLIQDVETANNLREKLGKDRIVVIIPRGDYIKRHRPKTKESVVGFVISPREEFIKRIKNIVFYSWEKIFIGSRNVMFLIDDQKDKGTIAHELAHTLGQGREFYELVDENDEALPDQEQCQRFNSKKKPELCYEYKIPRALYTEEDKQGKFLQFLINPWPIMNSRGGTIDKQWISRETYQQTFSFLHNPRNLPIGKKLLSRTVPSEKRYKVAIMGVYNHIRRSFDVPRARTYYTRISTPSFPKNNNYNIPVITFQLKEGNKVLKEVYRPIIEMEIKTFYRDKAPTTEPFYFSRMNAFIDLPKDQRQRDLKVIVLSPEGKEIYSSTVSKEIHTVKK